MRSQVKQTLICSAVISVFLFGCKKTDLQPSSQEPAIINTNAGELSKHISTDNVGVMAMNVAGSMDATQNTLLDSSNKYPMELVGQAASPIYEGNTLKATHVDINDNYAYVSYNTEGDKYLGGIDVFDLSNVSNIKVVAEIIFPYRDISAILYYNNRLYFTGASDVSKEAGLQTPGIAGYIELSNGIPTNNIKILNIQGQTGTDLALLNNTLYVASGANGGITTIDISSFQVQKQINLRDVRSVAATSSKLATYSGESGVYTYNPSSLSLLQNWTPGTDIAESKRTIDFNMDYLLVAAGKQGMLYYNSNTGAKVGSVALPLTIPAGIDANDVVTNAVSNNNGLFLIANGAAGLYVADETLSHAIEVVGSLDLTGSANYVKSKGDYIYAAAGKGGLKIIKLTRPTSVSSCTGLPTYKGDANLNVNSGQNLSYSGAVALQNVNVNASLFFCGAMSISSNCNINSNGRFELHGSLACGQYMKGTSLIINANSSLNIEGSLVVYGDLILNSGAKLNFLGTGSAITVYGKVIKNSNVTITGSYIDTFGKLK